MKEKIEIKNRFSDEIIISGKYESIKDCLEKNRGAYLGGANLRDAYLGGADLRGADLRGADLGGANLRDAYLGGADLRGADLRGAYLGGADLRGANLRDAYLRGADLRGANLGGADLRGADLEGAKGYCNSHDFTQEIIRQQPLKTFNEKEWAVLGQIFIHKICWNTIKKKYKKPTLSICKKLMKVGFGEYLNQVKEVEHES